MGPETVGKKSEDPETTMVHRQGKAYLQLLLYMLAVLRQLVIQACCCCCLV